MRVSRTIKCMAAAIIAAAPAIAAQEMATAKATLKGNGIAGTVELREIANAQAGHHDPKFDSVFDCGVPPKNGARAKSRKLARRRANPVSDGSKP